MRAISSRVVIVLAAALYSCVGHIRDTPYNDDASQLDASADRVALDAPPTDGGGCSAGLVACGGRCVDITRDSANCGACGMQCAIGTSCASGTCRSSCATGQTACGSPATCVTLASDPMNCGACGQACATGQVCSAGACVATCAQTMCGSACVDLRSDPSHCGACATMCGSGENCAAGACTCARGTMRCAGTCVDVATDNANCGACGRACGAGQNCVAGACACSGGQTLCGSACVNTSNDAANCGACGRACAAGQTCSAGTCSTTCAQTMCGSACVNTQTDAMHCGSCTGVCTTGQSCVGGACTVTCPSGQTNCSGTCANTQTDAMHCGACTTVCPAGQTCSAGACRPVTACAGAPSGATANQIAALDRENTVRTAMGLGCATMLSTINLGATRHCDYYAANRAISMCVANSHSEVASCSMFVAANFWDRMSMAGYTGSAAFEDMAFSNNGASAVQQWIDSVWHRTPVLSPWVRDIGYGSATGCDTMDFGNGAAASNTITATYPYANQTGVPTSFDGRYEGPMPPAPPGGWPSGYPIHVYAKTATITAHVLTLTGSSTPIPHIWIGSADAAAMGLLPNANVMYANAPLTAATRYHVHIAGTYTGGPLALDWDFTTR